MCMLPMPHMFWYPQKPDENTRSPKTGVTGHCGSPSIDAGN